MNSPEGTEPPAPSPLDAERARLRKEGFSDAEISQILIARATMTRPQTSTGGGGHGMMTGVLSNLGAVLSHARVLLPTFKTDLAAIFDRATPPIARVQAAVVLVLKTAVVSVLAYAVYQEWQQHIVSQTEIAQITARKLHAEECSARMKTFADITPMDELLDPARTDSIQRDCDPVYAAHAKVCDQKFDTLFSQLQQVDKKDTLAFDKLGIELFKHRQDCITTLEQRARLDTMKAELDASSERIKVIAGLALALRYNEEADREFNAGHYAAAYEAKKKARETVENREMQKLGKPGKATGAVLAHLAWYALFAHEYSEALSASERALALLPQDLATAINHAHALMFMDRTEEAKAAYLAHRGEKIGNKTWEQVIAEDFAELRKAGITHPFMAEIEQALAPSPPPPAPVAVQQPPVPAPSSLPATTQPYRTPTKFNCANANLGVDFVVCDSPQLMDAMARLEDAYAAARAAKGDAIKAAQKDWSLQFWPYCGLPKKGRPSSQTAYNAQACIFRALNGRIEYLESQSRGD
jgi:tetratricopeptide (TPR) repeat protein